MPELFWLVEAARKTSLAPNLWICMDIRFDMQFNSDIITIIIVICIVMLLLTVISKNAK